MPQHTSRHQHSLRSNDVNWKRRIVLSALAILLISWVGLMLYLPYFRINKIEFAGLTLINKDEINTYINEKYLTSKILPKNNFFLVNKSKIADDIAAKYATTKVQVTKIFPGILSIVIEEKITSIIYDNGCIYALLDNNGTVVLIIPNGEKGTTPAATSTTTTLPAVDETLASSATHASSTEAASSTANLQAPQHTPDWRKLSKSYNSVPILYDTRQLSVTDKQTAVLSSDLINSIIDLETQIREAGVGEVRYFTTDNPVAGVSATTNKPWKLLLQPSASTADQISNLKTLLGSNNVQPVEYIDLRYGERVFWK